MNRVIKLFGFEEGLADLIGADFTYPDDHYNDVIVVPGRNIFVGKLPEASEILKATPQFREDHEPVLGLSSITGRGLPPTSSSSSKQEWNVQIVLRFGVAPEVAKGLLESLCDFLIPLRGRVGTGFQIKGSLMVSRPTQLAILQNDNVLVSSVIRFFGVPLRTLGG